MTDHEPRGLTAAARAAMTRRLCAVVLIFEGFVVFFGALVASRSTESPVFGEISSGLALSVGGGLALGCVLATGLLRGRAGVPVGWAVQVLVLATGLVVPAMVVLALLFGGLWLAALRIGALVAAELPDGG